MVLDVKNGKITSGLEDFRIKAENDIYMETMIKALAKVGKNYITYDTSFQLERTYVCEFYHQWSLLLSQKGNNPCNLCLNGEPCKHTSQKAGWKYPDLILHHSQADNANNRIACEFKRKRWTEAGFDKDMQTLHFMLTGALQNSKLTENFKWGVFIQIGGDIENIEDYVKTQQYNENIFCIVVNDEVTQIVVKTIGEMR